MTNSNKRKSEQKQLDQETCNRQNVTRRFKFLVECCFVNSNCKLSFVLLELSKISV